ncbi:MAG TPA: polysaccharide deacetylase family protein [Sphingomicrobium sp.]|nr:polysaccharide deacetylase family protein [Sphingomicrobium sp.]
MFFLSPVRVGAATGEVALTFDDLPALTILPDQPYVDYLNATILRKLRRHHVPAIGFVNESKIDDLVKAHQIANLEAWVKDGMELGNHSFSHQSLNDVGAHAYIADIAKGEPVTNAILERHGKHLGYFRAPYLETGSTAATKDEVENWLTTHGYRMAPVTIDADDWEFAEPYDDAIARKDPAQQQHIRAEYLAYSATRVAWAQASARALFGRDIRHVMLLHCTRLNADTLDDLLKILKRAGLRPVSLETALEDPVYRLPDTYVGKDGIDWLQRWAQARNVVLPEAGSEDPPSDIQADYDRVDNDRQ